MSRKTAALGITALTLITSAWTPAYAHGGRDLWATVTIVPGREGIVAAAGYTGPALGAGSRLTLTAPEGTEVTDTPLDAHGYRGAVDTDGDSATYTYTGTTNGGAWQAQTFPFVLAVPADAVPGTRLTGCAIRLTDAHGTRKAHGTCAVTVGLPEPTLTRPESGVSLGTRPETAGTAYPGAQVTVRHEDAQDEVLTGDGPEPGTEVCATTADTGGSWSCRPGLPLPAGPGRLQVTASLNGVSAVSEQKNISVGSAAR